MLVDCGTDARFSLSECNIHNHNLGKEIDAITVNPSTDLSELNKILHLMGWEHIELDEYTLQLIIEIFESDFDSDGKRAQTH